MEPGNVCYRGHGHSGETGIFDGVWNSEGTLMATSGDDGVRLWNREGRHLETLKVPQARGIAFASDALFVASATGLSRYPMVSEVTGDGLVITFQAPEPIGSFRACMQASLSADGTLLAVAGRRADPQDDAAAIWLVDLHTGHAATLHRRPAGSGLLRDQSQRQMARCRNFAGQRSPHLVVAGCRGVERSADPRFRQGRIFPGQDVKRLVTGDTEAYRFWKTGTWELEREIPSEMGGRHGMMAYSPRMTALIIACQRGRN